MLAPHSNRFNATREKNKASVPHFRKVFCCPDSQSHNFPTKRFSKQNLPSLSKPSQNPPRARKRPKPLLDKMGVTNSRRKSS